MTGEKEMPLGRGRKEETGQSGGGAAHSLSPQSCIFGGSVGSSVGSLGYKVITQTCLGKRVSGGSDFNHLKDILEDI